MNHRYDWRKLESFCTALFEKAGVKIQDARIISGSLVEANLRGVDSHGVVRTEIYLQRLLAGMINTDGEMKLISDDPLTILDGNNHFGAVVGSKALEISIEQTKKNGTGIVGVKGSNHFGSCAYYLSKAVKEDMIMLIMSNASQTMPPTGGIRPFLGTNPLSVGIPAGKYLPFILDMATSVVARGKIISASQKGDAIPENWAIDQDGQPTTSAHEALNGSVLPFGGAKGYAISMFIDILCGVLTGAGFGKYVNNMYENWDDPQNVGHFFIGIDISKFMPIEEFKNRIDLYFEEIKAEPTAPGVGEILIPGELEYRSTLEKMKNGIEIPKKVEDELSKWADEYHLDLSEAILTDDRENATLD